MNGTISTLLREMPKDTHLSGNGDLNLDTGLNVDDDLLDDLSWGVKAVGLLVLLLLVSWRRLA